ncbi:hypothetical protein LTR62_000142 [Meristemomyces frigidus]|uniref:C2H2-type domain-containing protein n=1 Tax=Meristemomyces frigidus TaxID=1508187 RepID=A0AAN7YUN0_9PEZI|nr:hypothetical protein LTR62_000142 [Meristemomyces frigidus]
MPAARPLHGTENTPPYTNNLANVTKDATRKQPPMRKVKCTYSDCQEMFPDQKAMRRHKKYNDEHDYCKPCDIDFQDFETFTQHKVTMMDEFQRNRKHVANDARPKHIVCEFCGEDFETFGGRRLHRERTHQAEQQIKCPGCCALFTRAGYMIGHLEEGDCPEISGYEFTATVRHKHVLKAIMEDPGTFQERLCESRAFASNGRPGDIPEQEGAVEDDDEGGTTLLEQDDEDQSYGIRPLQPEVDLISTNVPLTRVNLESWPRLPGRNTASKLTSSMAGLSLAGHDIRAAESEKSELTSRPGGNKVKTVSYTESYSAHSSPTDDRSIGDNSETVSTSTITSGPQPVHVAWTAGNTSDRLFEKVKLPPSELHTNTEPMAEIEPDTSRNLLYERWYDSNSGDYDVDAFYHMVFERYVCPFPQCDINECQYDIPSDLEAHMQMVHLELRFVCPGCLKRFDRASKQVSHMESNGNCRVKEMDHFMEYLNYVTGGFIKAKYLQMPFVVQPSSALLKMGQHPLNGVKALEYTGKLPHER